MIDNKKFGVKRLEILFFDGLDDTNTLNIWWKTKWDRFNKAKGGYDQFFFILFFIFSVCKVKKCLYLKNINILYIHAFYNIKNRTYEQLRLVFHIVFLIWFSIPEITVIEGFWLKSVWFIWDSLMKVC